MVQRLALSFLVVFGFIPSLFAAKLECRVEFVTFKADGEDMEVELLATKSQSIEGNAAKLEISNKEMTVKREGYLKSVLSNISSATAEIRQNVGGSDIVTLRMSVARGLDTPANSCLYGVNSSRYGRVQHMDELATTAKVSTVRAGDQFALLADSALSLPTFAFRKPGWVPRLRCAVN